MKNSRFLKNYERKIIKEKFLIEFSTNKSRKKELSSSFLCVTFKPPLAYILFKIFLEILFVISMELPTSNFIIDIDYLKIFHKSKSVKFKAISLNYLSHSPS